MTSSARSLTASQLPSVRFMTTPITFRLTDGLGPRWKFYKRKRQIIVLLIFLGMFISLSTRINLMIAITVMVKSSVNPDGEFNWDMPTVGFILSSFYYGQLIVTFLGGFFANKIGYTKLFGISVGVATFISIFTQYCARIHWAVLIVLRIIEGLLQGMAFPSSLGIWTLWIPPLESSRLTAFAYSGAYVGLITTMAISGIIIEALKWPAVFQIYGGLGTVWYGAWLGLVYSSPNEHPTIDPKEMAYLNDQVIVQQKEITHPWSKIFTSLPVYSLLLCHFSFAWSQYTYSQLPMYFQDVEKANIVQAGFLSSVPYVVLVCVMQIVGNLIYYMLRHDIMPLTKIRKIFMPLGFAIQGVFFFLITFSTSNAMDVVFLAGSAAAEGISEPNFVNNILEIAPRHASVLLGISNTVATLAGICSAILTGYIVPDKTRSQWSIVFTIAACICWLAGIFYIMAGSAEVQPWAVEDLSSDERSTTPSTSTMSTVSSLSSLSSVVQ